MTSSVAADARTATMAAIGSPNTTPEQRPRHRLEATTGLAILLSLLLHMAGSWALTAAGQACTSSAWCFAFVCCRRRSSVFSFTQYSSTEHYYGGIGMVPWNFTAGEIAETFFFTLAWEAS